MCSGFELRQRHHGKRKGGKKVQVRESLEKMRLTWGEGREKEREEGEGGADVSLEEEKLLVGRKPTKKNGEKKLTILSPDRLFSPSSFLPAAKPTGQRTERVVVVDDTNFDFTLWTFWVHFGCPPPPQTVLGVGTPYLKLFLEPCFPNSLRSCFRRGTDSNFSLFFWGVGSGQ